MRRIVGKDKKGRTVLINVPSYDDMYINNQFGPQTAYDVGISSNGSGSADSSTPVVSNTQKAIFGYGGGAAYYSITNLVSNIGVVATDTTGVGTARSNLAAAGYGTDKAIFGYGYYNGNNVSMTNKVSNTGVVATDTTGVGTARNNLAAAGYGTDKAIFGFGGGSGGDTSITNLVSNTGTVASDQAALTGTVRQGLAAAGYSLS